MAHKPLAWSIVHCPERGSWRISLSWRVGAGRLREIQASESDSSYLETNLHIGFELHPARLAWLWFYIVCLCACCVFVLVWLRQDVLLCHRLAARPYSEDFVLHLCSGMGLGLVHAISKLSTAAGTNNGGISDYDRGRQALCVCGCAFFVHIVPCIT